MTSRSIPSINHFSALVETENFSDDSDNFTDSIEDFIKSLQLHVVKKIDHRFDPIGKTYLFLLSQSHLAVHTWPEYKMFHIDLVSCSPVTEKEFNIAIKKSFSEFGILSVKLEIINDSSSRLV